MMQGRNEPIPAFKAMVRGKDALCEFIIPCNGKFTTCQVGCPSKPSYSDQMIMDTIIKGIPNEDIKSKILGREAPNFLLDKVTWITAKESGMIASKGLSSTLATQSIIATSETPWPRQMCQAGYQEGEVQSL